MSLSAHLDSSIKLEDKMQSVKLILLPISSLNNILGLIYDTWESLVHHFLLPIQISLLLSPRQWVEKASLNPRWYGSSGRNTRLWEGNDL